MEYQGDCPPDTWPLKMCKSKGRRKIVRRQTEHVKQLKRMYSHEDGRLKGEGSWEKFPLFWFLLFLSYRCTRRCSYCYAFNQVGDDNKLEMDENTFARLLDWIPEVWKLNNVKVNTIGFLGGEPLLRTDRIKKVMDAVYKNTDGMQGLLYTNGDLIDSVNWDDLEDIQWINTNITDISIEELSRRMNIISERSNVIGQTIVATLDDYNLERVLVREDVPMTNCCLPAVQRENQLHVTYIEKLFQD
ncbi:MAG: radical SAM protein [Desulfitobacteriaceae bacterium]